MIVQAYFVGVRFEVDVVAQPHQRDDQTELLGEFLAECPDPVEDAAFLARVDKSDQTHADQDRQDIHVQVLFGFFLFCCRARRGRAGGFFFVFRLVGLACAPGEITADAAQREEGCLRKARHEGEGCNHDRGDDQRLRIPEHLACQVIADGVP